MEKLRVFVAIDFPQSLKSQSGGVVGKLRSQYPQIRWEKEENLHLTLKFLGWSEEKKTEGIVGALKKATEGISPFWLWPTKLGYFLRESLIVWLGIEAQEGLTKLVKNLEKEMAQLGFLKEKREFTSHITLGRARHVHPVSRWRQIAQEISQFETPNFAKFKVKEIVLMKSQLSPQGSIYKILNSISLRSS